MHHSRRYAQPSSLFEISSQFIYLDFNSTPEEAVYSLLVGDEPTDASVEQLESSRIVHVSIDPTISKGKEPRPNIDVAEGEEVDGPSEELGDPDKEIVNFRACSPSDGLLTLDELRLLFR